jgi:hypothetical protein
MEGVSDRIGAQYARSNIQSGNSNNRSGAPAWLQRTTLPAAFSITS